MDKFEKILDVPASYISKEVANRMAQRIHIIAEEQVKSDYLQALKEISPSLKLSVEDAVRLYEENTHFRKLLVTRKDRTIFVSPHGSVQYAGRDVLYDEIPKDPSQIIIDVPGINGKYLNISLTTDFMQNLPIHTMNKILIQGNDRKWVYSLYQEFQSELADNKKIIRDFVYRWFNLIGFLGFIGLSFLEFRLFHFFFPQFTLFTPLTGLASLLLIIILLHNQYIIFSLGRRAMRYLYPYFELEDRLSERRKDLRKLWIVAVTALYGGAVWAAVTTIWELFKN